MTPIFKRVFFTDEFVRYGKSFRGPLRFIRFPSLTETHEFQSYCLGYRWEATQRELRIIQKKEMFGQGALTLRDTDSPLTFAELLGPELIPEVNPSPTELLRVEARVREAAASWTHFFETMPDA